MNYDLNILMPPQPRSTTQLLKLLHNELTQCNQPKKSNGKWVKGLCELIRLMECRWGMRTYHESKILNDYVQKHGPKNHLYRYRNQISDITEVIRRKSDIKFPLEYYYRWKPYEIKHRKQWLEKQIKKLEDNG